MIFDCDGLLVDSERLAVRTEAEILRRLDWPLAESEMAVFGFAGGVTGAAELALGSAVVFEEMLDLPELLFSE